MGKCRRNGGEFLLKKLLVVFDGGGHTAQMLALVERLGKSYDYEYLSIHEDQVTLLKLKKPSIRLHRPKAHGDNFFIKVIKTTRSFFEAIKIILKTNPDAIVSAGPGVAVPISYAAKLLGKRVIFIESWSRVYNKSTSGKLVYPISDLFFVQWPEMQKLYPKAVYAGRLL